MEFNQERNWEISKLYQKLHFSEEELFALLDFLDSNTDFKILSGDFSLSFMDEKHLAELHDTFMDDPSPTDVITFKGDPNMGFAGEVCISVDRAIEVHNLYEHTLAEELTLYIIHGWLHLAGYDDLNEEDRLKMKNAEKILMQRAKNACIIPNFSIQ